MYIRKDQSWIKHLDFLLLDELCLQIAFVLAYMTRHGCALPYGDSDYLQLAVVYTLVDILVLNANRTMKNVLKRGFYKELEQTIWHVIMVALVVSLYIFSVQQGIEYSRITFYLTSVYYLLIAYSVRLLWKKYLMKKKQELCRTAVYFVTTRGRAEYVSKRFFSNNITSRKIQGMCILDEDCTGQMIAGVQVNASRDTLIKHLCEIWVDEVFVSVSADNPLPMKLLSDMAEMGIVVHMEMEQLEGDLWQHQVIQKFAGATVRTISMTMATPMQAILKRLMDIAGGLVGCVITGLLTIVIGPMIYIHSPGPIFFKQTRVGKNGRKFQIYKFRSMYLDAEARKAALMSQNRIQSDLMFNTNIAASTEIGRFLDETIPRRPVMPLGQQLLEVKYDEYLPDFIYRNLQLHSLRQTAFSKYYICRKFMR